MKRTSLLLAAATLTLSLSGCGLLNSVGRLGGSALRLPSSLLKTVTDAEAAQPGGEMAPSSEDAIETAHIATAPIE